MAVTDANPRPKWDTHNPHSSAGQVFVKTVRKIYNPLGFHKGYNFPFFLVGSGSMIGFALARFMYLDWSIFSRDAIPGEMYYYREGYHRVGIMMHLIGILPGSFLASFQFVPIIRYKFILFHRLNGYVAALLLIVANVGAFMILDVAVGASPQMMIWGFVLGVMITIALGLAIWNIKRLQIDQHRAWMLRAWTWAAHIITLRLLMMAGMHVSRAYGYVYHSSFKCAQIYFMYQHVGVPDQGNPTGQIYPTCNLVTDVSGIPTGAQINPADNRDTYVTVSSVGQGPENVAALIHPMFHMAMWLALAIHIIVIEVYLWLTPAESYRLRNVSYERQVEKGIRKRGAFKDAGLTGTRIGNAPEWWSIPIQDYEEQKKLMLQGGQEESKLREQPDAGSSSDGMESERTAVPPRAA